MIFPSVITADASGAIAEVIKRCNSGSSSKRAIKTSKTGSPIPPRIDLIVGTCPRVSPSCKRSLDWSYQRKPDSLSVQCHRPLWGCRSNRSVQRNDPQRPEWCPGALESVSNRLRVSESGPQQTTSHGRLGFIQIPIQATMFLPSPSILCQIKTSLGRKVHLQEITNLIMMGFFWGGSIPAFVSGGHTGEVFQPFFFLAHSTDPPKSWTSSKRRLHVTARDSSG